MDKPALLAHLTHFHQQVIDEMYAVTRVRAPPADIRIRPWLHADASWGRKTDKPKQGFIIIDEGVPERGAPLVYLPELISQKECFLVHETGHHVHAQSDAVWAQFDLYPNHLEQRTPFEKRLHRYDELVAEFFMCCYYERNGKLMNLVESERNNHPFYNPIHALYQAIPPELGEREQTCRWLVTYAYTDVRRQFRGSETLERIGRFVRNEM